MTDDPMKVLPYCMACLMVPAIVSSASAKQATAVNPSGRWQATITQTCAPWDGPAFNVSLIQNPRKTQNTPRIDVNIWKAPAFKQPIAFSLSKTSQEGSVFLWTGPETSQPLQGQIWFKRVQESQDVEGRFRFVTETGQIKQGVFKAVWKPVRLFCG